MITRRVFLVTVLPASAIAAGCVGLAQKRTPAEVFIIRHAEEPVTGPHLSDQGRERAKALVQLFSSRFTKPTALYATATSGSSTRSAGRRTAERPRTRAEYRGVKVRLPEAEKSAAFLP